MKELMFLIAEKIATDNNPNTILICGSILKEQFISMGFTRVLANEMAIDSLKIVLNTMINFKK